MKLYSSILIILIIFIIGVLAFISKDQILDLIQNAVIKENRAVDPSKIEPVKKSKEAKMPDETAPVDVSEIAPIEETETTLPLTYINDMYGFQLSYSESCDALDDETNLYGWPNGIVLFYCGGQAYDVAVEVWDSIEEYEAKYPSEEYMVEEIGSQFVTVANITGKETNAEILESFELLE